MWHSADPYQKVREGKKKKTWKRKKECRRKYRNQEERNWTFSHFSVTGGGKESIKNVGKRTPTCSGRGGETGD